MATNSDRGRRGHGLLDASTEPASLAALARRRRLAHLIAIVLVAIVIVALIFGPSDQQSSNAASLIGGLSLILLGITAVVSIQYTVRIHLKRKRPTLVSPPADELECSARSIAYEPIQQLRSAARLLESVLPEIEHLRPGITATAGRTRHSLEHTAQRLLLEEQMLATLADHTGTGGARGNLTRQNVADLATRLRSGVDQYVNLTQQATRTATSLADISGDHELQDADEQLAGLNAGLQEVQQISAGRS